MAILTRSGRAAIARAVKAQALHLAWGTGLAAWDALPEVPAEDANATGLIAEIGRRKVTSAEYVTPDANGFIEIAGAGKFSVSQTPTNNLLVTTRFGFDESPNAVIRELGVFMFTETVAGLPAGQVYFTPAQIANPGMLLELQHKRPLYRDAGTRETIEILIVF